MVEEKRTGEHELCRGSNTEGKRTTEEEIGSLGRFVDLCSQTDSVIKKVFACMLESTENPNPYGSFWLTVDMGEGQTIASFNGAAPNPVYMCIATKMMAEHVPLDSRPYLPLGKVVSALYDAWRRTCEEENRHVKIVIRVSGGKCEVYKVWETPMRWDMQE